MGIVSDFQEFAVEGNAFDMAIGVVLGAAFGDVVSSLVDDVISPPLGFLLRGEALADLYWVPAGGSYPSAQAAREAGAVVITYGRFLSTILAFVIVALALFVVVRALNRLRRPDEEPDSEKPSRKACPKCTSSIPRRARRCPECTAELPEAPPPEVADEAGTPGDGSPTTAGT